MYLDHRYPRPSDNWLRVLAYTGTIGAVFTGAVLAANLVIAGNYGENTGFGSEANQSASDAANRLTTSTTRDSCMFGGCADQMAVGTRGQGNSGPGSGGCGCVNSVGRMSGPV